MASAKTLRLISERKLHELLPMCDEDSRLEASGIVRVGSHYFIVCDDIGEIARVDVDLKDRNSNGFLGGPYHTGFESIAFDPESNHFFLLVEAVKDDAGRNMAKVVECDADLHRLGETWLEFPFDDTNRGFEGLAHLRRDGQEHLLALCEGNRCQGGKRGEKPGNGRIQVFQREGDRWNRVREIKLPKSVKFKDYAGMAIVDGQIAVVSQSSSRLWIGELDVTVWETSPGIVYDFPRTSAGKRKYGNVEGVCMLSDDCVVVVSDKRKKRQPKRQAKKDRSIHVFEVPDLHRGES